MGGQPVARAWRTLTSALVTSKFNELGVPVPHPHPGALRARDQVQFLSLVPQTGPACNADHCGSRRLWVGQTCCAIGLFRSRTCSACASEQGL